MKRYSLFIILIVAFIGFSACEESTPMEEEAVNKLTTKTASEIVEANNTFAFEFLKEINAAETEENFMVSPVSLSLALGMAYNGSEGTTKLAFDEVLNYSSSLAEVNTFNNQLINKLSGSDDGSVMEIANSIWIDEGFPVKEEFITLNKTYYYAEVANLDFKNPSSVDVINNWVSDKTHEKIPSIINSTEDNVLFLINALYFNANWRFQFDPDYTNARPFFLDDTEFKRVEMMTMTETVDYMNNELFSSVILPYEKDKFSMVILLPHPDKSTDDIIAALNSERWNSWLDDYDTTKVSVNIPKFKLEYKNKLNDELIKMGLGIAFSDGANFSNISDIPLLISYILQKTYIDVKEEGTEAAAVTVIGFETTSIDPEPQPLFFHANRPFVYVIKENSTGSVCFVGKVGDPDYED